MSRRIALTWERRPIEIELTLQPSRAAMIVEERVFEATIRRDGAWVEVRHDGRVARCAAVAGTRGVWVSHEGRSYFLERVQREAAARSGPASDEIRSPMTGRVVSVAARPGAVAREGDLLVTIEAMKMEFRLTAPEDGTVLEVACGEGDRVELGQLLVRLEPAGNGAAGSGKPAEGSAGKPAAGGATR